MMARVIMATMAMAIGMVDGNIHLHRRVAQANKNDQVLDVFMLLGH